MTYAAATAGDCGWQWHGGVRVWPALLEKCGGSRPLGAGLDLGRSCETLEYLFHRRTVMSTLQTIHGRLVDLRRYTNVHLYYGRRPLGPTERNELWIKPTQGEERKFTVNTRNLPARCGHEISLIVTDQKVPEVLGLVNWSILDGVNFAHSEAPPLVRVWDFPLLAVVFLIMATIWGAVGMLLFVPGTLAYWLLAGIGRSFARTRRACRVYRAMDVESQRLSRAGGKGR
jgi:hypothetical protein